MTIKSLLMSAVLVGATATSTVALADHHDHDSHEEKKDNWKFESKGWTKLGERTVNGKADHDRITVGRYKGKFSKMTVVVYNSDLEMNDMEVKFAKGEPWHPDMKQTFHEGERSRQIDFPGDERTIKFIDFKYANTPGGGKAKVEVWAQ
ncbi:MAG TPA: hypothetical protein VGM39_12045 [Kofleriaceae bacterium]